MPLKDLLLNLYRFIFARKIFYKFNLHLYKITLRGIGVLNSEGEQITGEEKFLSLLGQSKEIKTIFDVGANDGGYSQTVRKYFPRTQIYAFEPQPESFERLKKVSRKSGLKIYKLGMGNKQGLTKIWDFADDAKLKDTQPTSTLASLYKEVIEKYHGQKVKSFNIKITTLDEFTKKNSIKTIDFIKIDTEGNEFQILLGAKNLIRTDKIRVIQFEFNEMNAYSKTFFKDFYDLLTNFRFYRLLPDGPVELGEYRPLNYEIFGFQNIVAVNNNCPEIIALF